MKAVVRGWESDSDGLLRQDGRRRDIKMEVFVELQAWVCSHGKIGNKGIRSICKDKLGVKDTMRTSLPFPGNLQRESRGL